MTSSKPQQQRRARRGPKFEITVGGALAKASDEPRWVSNSRQRGSPTHVIPGQDTYGAGRTVSDFSLAPSYNTVGPLVCTGNSRSKRRIQQQTENAPPPRAERRMTASVKRKRSRDPVPKHRTEGNDAGSERDSNVTDTTTSHTAKLMKVLGEEQHSKHIENARTASNTLFASLKDLDKASLKEDDLLAKKAQLLNDTLNSISSLDPYFGDLLRQLHNMSADCHTRFRQDLARTAEENAKLRMELATAQQERQTEQQKQREETDGLKRELAEACKMAKDIEGRYKEKMRELAEDAKGLYKENRKLASVAKKLYSELKRAKRREHTLTQLLKGEAPDEASVEESDTDGVVVLPPEENVKPAANRTMIEVGNNKVKLPVLDFSRLAPKKPTKLKVVEYCKEGTEEQSNQEIEILDEDFDRIVV